MDDVLVLLITANLACAVVLYLLISGRNGLNLTGEEINERIEAIEQGIQVVGSVLERLPDLVPQFSINQNPFQSLIEAFAEKMKANMGEASYSPPALRDDEGRYSAEAEEATEA